MISTVLRPKQGQNVLAIVDPSAAAILEKEANQSTDGGEIDGIVNFALVTGAGQQASALENGKVPRLLDCLSEADGTAYRSKAHPLDTS